MLIRRSALIVLAAAVLIAALPDHVVHGQPSPATPVKAAIGWSFLLIDGNQNGKAVAFPHVEHQERLAESSACQTCHHLDFPPHQGTACANCHQDYYLSSFIFDHTQHQDALNGNDSCSECHHGEHNRNTAIACSECHDQMISLTPYAPGYQTAMHGACLQCHLQQASAQNKPTLGECATCHNNSPQSVTTGTRRLP